MAAKKRPVKQEPLLITIARKLGQAAGTITNVTQELKDNLSTLPDSVAKKVRNATDIDTPPKRLRVRTRHRTQRPKKTIRHATRSPKARLRKSGGS